MKFKDILSKSAKLLGENEVATAVKSNSTVTDQEILRKIELLVNAGNIVMGEACTMGMKAKVSQTMSVNIGSPVYISALDIPIIEIIGAVDYYTKEKIDYRLQDNTLYFSSSKAIFEYYGMIDNNNLSDDLYIEDGEIFRVILAYGIASEYCLMERRFDEAVMWRERFVKAFNEKLVKNKSVKTKMREWK